MTDFDPFYDPQGLHNDWTLCWDALPDSLKREHGWTEFRAYKSAVEWEPLKGIEDFVMRGLPRFVLDATELFYDLLLEEKNRDSRSSADPAAYERKINVIFEDDGLPWRMLDGRIIRVDSKWLQEEIHAKVTELLSTSGFDGALDEFRNARLDLSSGDYKGAISNANLALESTIKAILGLDQEKPGALYRKLIESGMVPEYHEGFLQAFEEHILRAVAVQRNFEKGVGHGQGGSVNVPPPSLAELGVNLAGVLMLYLLKRYLEVSPKSQETERVPQQEPDENETPF